MYPLLAGVPASDIERALGRIYRQLAGRDPALVYFRHADLAAQVERVCAAPDRQAWLAWVGELVTRLPWARDRGLRGEVAWRRFMHDWGALLEELARGCPFRTLTLEDAWRDRDASAQEILAFCV